MAKSISDRVSQVSSTVADTLKTVSSNIAKGADASVDYVMDKTGIETDDGKDFGVAGIKEHILVRIAPTINIILFRLAGSLASTAKST
jgi:hypothetical protein